MSDGDSPGSLKLVIQKQVAKNGKANYEAREVGVKSARLDTSSSSGGASPDLNKGGPWKDAANKSAVKKQNKKKKKF